MFNPNDTFLCDRRDLVLSKIQCVDDYTNDTALRNDSPCRDCALGASHRYQFSVSSISGKPRLEVVRGED